MPIVSGSPTQTMIDTLEVFQQSEPEAILILFLDEAGRLNYRSNIDSVALRIGMCEAANAAFKNSITG